MLFWFTYRILMMNFAFYFAIKGTTEITNVSLDMRCVKKSLDPKKIYEFSTIYCIKNLKTLKYL